MTDARESEGQAYQPGVERPAPPRRPRIDEMFAGAMEEQLSEQRALNELLRRVEASLGDIRRELAERPAHPQHDEPVAVEVPAELQSLPSRIDELQSAIVSALAVRDDVDRLGTAGLLRRVEELREEVESRLSARDEQAETAIAESMAALREHAVQMDHVRSALSEQTGQAVAQLAEIIQATTTNQQAALTTIESAAARIETLQHEMRDRLAEIVASSVSDLQAASATAAQEQAARVQEGLAAVREAAAAAGADLPQRVESAAKDLRDVVDDAANRLGAVHGAGTAELSEAAAALARVAEGLGPAIATTARDVRTAMREAVDEDRAHVEAEMGRRSDELRAAVAAEVQKLSDSAAGVLSALQETTASVGAGFGERIDAAGRNVSEVVSEVREALLVTAEEDRQQMRDALTDLRSSAKQIAGELQASLEQTDAARTSSAAELAALSKSVRGLQGEVEGLATRLAAAVTEQEERARSATDGLGDRVETLLEGIRTSTGGELHVVQRTVSALREELEHATRGTTELVDKVVARLDEAADQHLTTASNVSAEVLDRTKSLDQTAATLARVAGNIEPALAETAGEVLTALRQTAKDDRAQMRDGIARIQQSAERMGESLQATMVRHIESIHAASAAELAGVNQSLAAARRALEDSANALAGAVAQRAADTGAATGAQVAELQVAVDDLRSLLERAVADLRRPPDSPALASAPDIDEEALAATLSMVGGAYNDDDEDDEDA